MPHLTSLKRMSPSIDTAAKYEIFPSKDAEDIVAGSLHGRLQLGINHWRSKSV